MAYQILTQLFADRELRIVRHPIGKQPQKRPSESAEDSEGFVVKGESHESHDETVGCEGVPGCDDGSPSYLVSTREFVKRTESELQNRVYGRSQREKLRRVGVAAEQMHPNPGDWWFFTITYPTESPAGMAAIARESGWVVKSLKNWIAKYETDETHYFYCWERQKRGTLHLHYAAYLPTAAAGGLSQQRFKDWCIQHVHKLCSRTGENLWMGPRGDDWSVNPWVLRCDAQKVVKSVSRYLAKYVSKGASANSLSHKASPSPRRWTGYSQSLKDAVDRLTIVKRIVKSSYQSAASYFKYLVDNLVLFHPKCIHYRNVLEDCEGETFSMFKEKPCRRLRRFMALLPTELNSSESPFNPDTEALVSEWSELSRSLAQSVLRLEGVKPGWQPSSRLSESLLRALRETTSQTANWNVLLTEMQTAVTVFKTEFSTSRYQWNSVQQCEIRSCITKLSWVLHRLRQSQGLREVASKQLRECLPPVQEAIQLAQDLQLSLSSVKSLD